MKLFLFLTVIIAGSAWSDIARVYPAGHEPGIIVGTAAAAAVDVPVVAGREVTVVAVNGKEGGRPGGDLAR